MTARDMLEVIEKEDGIWYVSYIPKELYKVKRVRRQDNG